MTAPDEHEALVNDVALLIADDRSVAMVPGGLARAVLALVAERLETPTEKVAWALRLGREAARQNRWPDTVSEFDAALDLLAASPLKPKDNS